MSLNFNIFQNDFQEHYRLNYESRFYSMQWPSFAVSTLEAPRLPSLLQIYSHTPTYAPLKISISVKSAVIQLQQYIGIV